MPKKPTAAQVDGICDAFEAAWQDGNPPDLAQWLTRADPDLQAQLKIHLVRVDLDYRLKADPEFSVDEYLRNHNLSRGDVLQADTVTLVGPAQDSPVANNDGWVSIPTQIAKFRIEKELGRGGFGVVYKAFDTVLKRIVALKIPRDVLNEDSRKRFLREAEATAALDHPGLVPVFESGQADGLCYIATTYCPGPNLSQWIAQQERIPVRQAVVLVRDLADAMQHAHDRGVVHRDLKPSNVMIVSSGMGDDGGDSELAPRITDFGLAKLLEQRLEDTRTSVVLGTPSYMSPEQVAGQDSSFSAATDIYSLGVILYELLMGKRPFEGKTVIDVMNSIRDDTVPCLRKTRTDLPTDLETICLKCLAKETVDRYQSCAELANELSRFLQGQAIVARPPGLADKLRHWIHAPARVQETGLLSILLGLGVPVWILLVVIFVKIESLDAQVQTELIPQTLMVTVLLLLPLAWLGYQTLQRRRRWIGAGLIASIINLLMVSPPLLGYVVVFPDLYTRYPLGRIVAYTFLTLMFSIQLLQYAVALRSPSLGIRRNR